MSEDELLERLEKSRDSADKGIYKDAKKVSQNIREKYGL
jgi:hypothetical protein